MLQHITQLVSLSIFPWFCFTKAGVLFLALGICLFIDYTILKSCFVYKQGRCRENSPMRNFQLLWSLQSLQRIKRDSMQGHALMRQDSTVRTQKLERGNWWLKKRRPKALLKSNCWAQLVELVLQYFVCLTNNYVCSGFCCPSILNHFNPFQKFSLLLDKRC